MYTKLKSIYEQDTAQQKCVLLRSFYNYKYNPSKDAQENIAIIEHIQHRLNALKQPIDDTMVCEKILDTIPKEWDHINSAWEATEANKRTLSNLTSRLAKAAGKSGHEGPEEEKKTVCYRAEASRYKPKKKKTKKTRHIPHAKYVQKQTTQKMLVILNPETNSTTQKNHNRKRGLGQSHKVAPQNQMNKKSIKKPKYDNKGDKRSHSSEKGRKVSTETKSNYGKLCATSNNSGKNIVGGELCASIAMKCEKRNCQQSCCVNVTDSSSSHVCTQFCVDSGCTAHMTDNVEIIKHSTPTNDVIKTAKKELSMKSLCREKVSESEAIILHRKMGHMGMQNVKRLPKLCDGVNVEFTKQDMKLICEICKKAKQSKDPHNTSRERATGPLKIIHADVSPTSAVNKLPAEIWFNKRQDLSHLHIFGSTVYAKILSRVSKLESRTRKGMFLGYTKNGVRLWDKDKREIFVSRDNVFTEEIEATSDQESDVIEDVIFPDRFIDLNIRKESLMHETEQTANTEERLIKENNDNDINESEIFEEMDLTPVIQENHISEDETPDVIPNLEENQETQPKYSLRNRSSLKKPSRYSDFIMEEINEEEAHIAIAFKSREHLVESHCTNMCMQNKSFNVLGWKAVR
ncbi:hypothetical protein FOCC_FOCC006020 [Frankliniella occidentalis]|nr:hypothetical protein FOCC_FOCC006020 [Frankliniella occidentalis]